VVTHFEYDELDRLRSQTMNYLPTTQFAYDLAGNLRFVTDPRGTYQTEYRYDAAQRQILTLADPVSKHRYLYVAANPVSLIDAYGYSASSLVKPVPAPTPAPVGSPLSPYAYPFSDYSYTLDGYSDPTGSLCLDPYGYGTGFPKGSGVDAAIWLKWGDLTFEAFEKLPAVRVNYVSGYVTKYGTEIAPYMRTVPGGTAFSS